ncbi:MAG TPA: HAMP domain-containing histidine kinase, partial [Anaerolineae bacterium]|nr:HAMP domain-containing histidine kinase [Anaerolineae bacterium]
MFNSLRSRLWFTYALVIGVALGIVGIVFVLYFAKNPVQSLQARIRLQTAAETIFKRVSNIESIPLEQLQESIARADQAFDVRVLIYNQKTQLIIDSRQGEVPPLNLHIPLLRLKEGQQVSVLSKKDESGNGWLYLPKLIPNSMILVVATPQPAIGFWAALRSRGNDIFPTLRRAGLIALFFGLILAFWIAHWVSSPLQKMIQATKKISIGEYTDIPIEGPREVRSLANSFNEMAKKVRDSQQATRDFVANVSHDLKTPLTSIQGFAQALLDGTAGTPQAQKQAASVIFDEANHMHNMVLNLLDLARFDSG